MDNTYWLHQTTERPLFEAVIWNQPQRRNVAGKLAIIGGNGHGFNIVSEVFALANQAGIGVSRVLMPDSLSHTIGKIWPDCEFAPSTKSGGFATTALTEWQNLASWADGTLICGDLGRNSETAILLDRFLETNSEFVALFGDALDLAISTPLSLINRGNLLIGPSLSQFQKLLSSIRYPTAIKSSLSLDQLADLLHSLTLNYKLSIVYVHEGIVFIADAGQVSSTPTTYDTIGRTITASTVWRLQQPAKPFEAMTSAIYKFGLQAA